MDRIAFVAFEPREDGYVASVPIEQLDALGDHPEEVMREASKTYIHSIEAMGLLLDDLDRVKVSRTPIPAQKVWEFGDAVFRLVESLAYLSLEIDGLYEHLMRDLEIDKGRLGRYRMTRAITFRRYLVNKDLIPASLDWRRCEKNARKTAEQLASKSRESAVA